MASSPASDAHPPRIVLVGMMGAGKTTVGQTLAGRRGWDFLDSDAQIEARTGRTVNEIWTADGEPAFRRIESDVLATALAHERPVVVAAAGGVVLDPVNRAALGRHGPVVWLRARSQTLAARVGSGNHRPLLDDDPAGVLSRLVVDRADLYAEVADVIVDIDGLAPDEIADRVEAAVDQARDSTGARPPTSGQVPVTADGGLLRLTVGLGERSYPVLVGPGARHRLLEVLPVGAAKAAIVTQADIGVTVDAGVDQRVFMVGDGEKSKSLETVEDLCRDFARFGLTRTDVVVAVGGGMVTDAVGLAAALYHRGVAVVHVATSLLAQVDAAIGGKTGVNLPEGKNLVGAFWQPAAVLCDTEVLATLPPAEYRSGLGEMAKYHFLTDDLDLSALSLTERVARCVAIKAAFVSADEREDPSALRPGGTPRGMSRAVLNYGHTLAHALETAGHYGLRHGEAVAIGLVFAARLARRLGRIDDGRVAEHLDVVSGYGLPTTVTAATHDSELVDLMARDKKALDGFTLVLDGPRGPEVVVGIARADLEATLAEMRP
ncbi:MAG TPA: bifunctional shikimate kinase/3-dehydroquinate synthase [Acidimicrobiales bacterium]|nr:bifunctional shikimate kinase/3-dehydroquinate synthase [Acidimicrobiales bacterium]